MTMTQDKGVKIREAYQRYVGAISSDCSQASKLRVWSRFIRMRDEYRCVICRSENKISAHHICRKSLLPIASLQTGNGISLCRSCHNQVHAGFNGRPNMNLPMDMQGGEKLGILAELYRLLLADAIKRGFLCDDYYYLSDEVLQVFARFQGCSLEASYSMFRLEQAVLIWNQCPKGIRDALLRANGVYGDFPAVQPGEVLVIYD